MRQAGRILKEYREVRQRGVVSELVEHPEFAAEVTIQPVDLLGVDAAIIFPISWSFPKRWAYRIRSLKRRGRPLNSRSEQIRYRKVTCGGPEHLSMFWKPSESPNGSSMIEYPDRFCRRTWTILAYMVEGKGSKTFPLLRNSFTLNRRLPMHCWRRSRKARFSISRHRSPGPILFNCLIPGPGSCHRTNTGNSPALS